MAYRSRRLEALLGAQFDDLTYGHFVAIEGNPSTVESDDLDWKVKYDGEKKDANFEIAKDVAALANATGGLLVLGVDQEKSTSAARKVVGHSTTDRTEREFHQVLAAGAFPIPRYHIRRLTEPGGDGSRGIFMIGVPPSPLAPHAVIAAQRPDYAYPRRVGNKIEWLTEPEIATAYRRRFAESASREKRLDDIEFENLEVFFNSGQRGPVLTVSLVPEIPGSYKIDRKSYTEVQNATLSFGLIGVNDQRTLREITVGSSRLQATDDRTSPRIHCDFHSDGSGVWGVVPRVHRLDGPEEDEYDNEDIGYVQTNYIVAQVLSALLLLSQHATERAGVTGTALVRVSLRASVYDHQGFMAHATPIDGQPYDFYTLHLGQFEFGDRFHVESIRSVPHAHGDSVCVLDSITDGRVGLTQTAAFAAGAMFQAFGLIETPQIREDGTVRSYAFPHSDEQWWLEWCRANNIPAVRLGG